MHLNPQLSICWPLVQEEHGAFTPAQFTAMREALDLHPLLHRSNELDPINFGLSSGWAVQFNSEGTAVSLFTVFELRISCLESDRESMHVKRAN